MLHIIHLPETASSYPQYKRYDDYSSSATSSLIGTVREYQIRMTSCFFAS